MITVIARMKAKEGHEDELVSVLRELAVLVRAQEPGCALYQLAKAQAPREYVMLERYADQQALAAHSQSAYFKAAMPSLGAALEGRAAIEVLTELDA